MITDLEKLQNENKHLKGLVEQLYNMSCLEDMINDMRSGHDDEGLLCNLMLKSDIMEVLKKEEKKIEK